MLVSSLGLSSTQEAIIEGNFRAHLRLGERVISPEWPSAGDEAVKEQAGRDSSRYERQSGWETAGWEGRVALPSAQRLGGRPEGGDEDCVGLAEKFAGRLCRGMDERGRGAGQRGSQNRVESAAGAVTLG